MTNEELRKKAQCPGCGAIISYSDLQCDSCGFEIPKEGITGKTYIEELEKKLINLESKTSVFDGVSKLFTKKSSKSKKQGIVISNFVVPNDIEHLSEFFYFCHSNFETMLSQINKDFKDEEIIAAAWGNKAKVIYQKLKTSTSVGARQIIKEFEGYYGIKAKSIDSQIKYAKFKAWKPVIAVLSSVLLLSGIICAISIPACLSSRAKEQSALNQLDEKIEQAIKDKDYDLALYYANKIESNQSKAEQGYKNAEAKRTRYIEMINQFKANTQKSK